MVVVETESEGLAHFEKAEASWGTAAEMASFEQKWSGIVVPNTTMEFLYMDQ